MADEIAATNEYQSKHSTCDIQKHPWQAVFGAGFQAGRDWQREQSAERVRDLEAARDAWKESARHFRHGRELARQQEIRLKQRLWAEHEARVALVNAMTEILPRLAIYGVWCRACDSRVADGHRRSCDYVAALDAVRVAARSVEP